MAGREPTGADAEQGITAAHPRQNDRRVVGREGKVGIALQIVAHKVGEITRQQGFGAGDGEGALVRQILTIGKHPFISARLGATRSSSSLACGVRRIWRPSGSISFLPRRCSSWAIRLLTADWLI